MAIYRVKTDATGINDGSSWDNAFTSLQSALATAKSGDEIWLAQGVYKPGNNRTDSFEIPDGVTIYGGFAGDETNLQQRDIEKNITYLSGDIGKERDNKDNNYTVVKLNSGTATLDGLIIQDGNSNDDGGGVYNDGNLTLKNVVVTFNLAADSGGGIVNNGTINIIDSTIADNFAIGNNPASGGGGLINTGSATITNSMFSGNGAGKGGAIRNNANLQLNNSKVINNIAYSKGGGGGVANLDTVNVSNSVIVNNADDLANNFELVTGTNISSGNNIIGNGDGVSGFTDGSNGDKVGEKYNRIAVILNETFDNDSQFKKSSKFFSDGSNDYFGIYNQNATKIKSYTGFTNKFLAGQDLDGEGESLPITLTWSNLDIKWLTNLQFSGDFAEFFDSPGDIDDDDFIKVSYSIDGGQEQNLLWFSGSDFSNNSGSFNGVLKQDTDFDGIGDGQALNNAAQNFTTAITGTGSRLELKLEISLDSGDEDFALDNFLITGITAPIIGTESKDNLLGTESHDQISGFAGNDYLKGEAGDDVISGGTENDRLYGDDGEDTLTGGTGNDYLNGGNDEDSLEGGEGRDRLYGGDADDTLIGGKGNDYLDGGFGVDSLEGGEGNDRLYGGDLNDVLIGGSGKDYISAGSGNDAITGVDIVSFGVGEIDRLYGGAGEDSFILGNTNRCFYDDGNNKNKGRSDYAFIGDFNVNDDDILLFAGEDYYLTVTRGSSSIYIDNDGIEGFSCNDELIGVVKGVALTEGNIDGSTEGFNFV